MKENKNKRLFVSYSCTVNGAGGFGWMLFEGSIADIEMDTKAIRLLQERIETEEQADKVIIMNWKKYEVKNAGT